MLAGDVTTAVRQVTIDGASLHLSLISPTEHVVALHRVEKEQWDWARISVQVKIPHDELQRGTDIWHQVGCHVVLAERRTNCRVTVPLDCGDDGTYSGVVDLYRDRHLMRAQIETVVTATVDGIPGRIIGVSADAWIVDLAARKPTRQRSLATVWTDFTAAENVSLTPFRDDPWMIDTGGVEPTVFLNAGFEGLRALLSGAHGDRAARDALQAQIAMEVWISLFNTAAASLTDDDETWPGDWQELVLRKLLPDLFPDKSLEDARKELAHRRVEGAGDLQTRLIRAASKQARVPRTLTTFLRAQERHVNTADAGKGLS
jgi:hypothetical protein